MFESRLNGRVSGRARGDPFTGSRALVECPSRMIGGDISGVMMVNGSRVLTFHPVSLSFSASRSLSRSFLPLVVTCSTTKTRMVGTVFI